MTQPAADPLAPLLELPGVPDAVDAARAAVDEVYRHPANRRGWPTTAAEATVRAARASAALDGGAAALSADGVVRDPVLAGALRAAEALGGLLGAWQRAPLQALARLHVLAASDIVPDSDALGRPRPVGAPYDDPLELGAAPDPLEVAARLDGLARVLTAGTSAPAVVVAAVVHGELMALRPFGTADGLVARAAARLVLVDRGLDPKAVSAPEVGHAELHHDYPEALHAYVSGGPAGVARWIVHCAQAVSLGAREGLAVCEAIRRGTT